MQRWKPDTCGCVILEESGTSAYLSHEVVCPEHSGLTAQKLATVPLEHNTRKNKVDGIIQTLLGSTVTETDPDSGAIVWKKGITFNWSYSGVGESRILSVSVSGVNLTNNQKTSIQNWCDTNLGAGKVVIG